MGHPGNKIIFNRKQNFCLIKQKHTKKEFNKKRDNRRILYCNGGRKLIDENWIYQKQNEIEGNKKE